jgi:HTH-type transcriptional regulator/antitoxin HigA
MELSSLTEADLAKLLGSASRASEIMRRKRHLTVEMIWTLNREWRIPAESLIRPYELERT